MDQIFFPPGICNEYEPFLSRLIILVLIDQVIFMVKLKISDKFL